ncbi:MAG: hypothetical protein RR255_00070 [Bacilli bacterium]
MKLFKSVIDDGKSVFKTITPAKSKKEYLSTYGGNGEFIYTKDVTKDYPLDVDFLIENLAQSKLGKIEQKLVVALVEAHMQANFD